MNNDYDKVIEFFSEHEIAIYGFGPTDYGAEEGTLLWCIKELHSMFDINIYIDDRDMIIKQRTLKVICTLIDIYEKEDAKEIELNNSIEAESIRHAYWEPSEIGEYHCTNCGVECDVDKFHKALLNSFCGNCGAKMDGGAK